MDYSMCMRLDTLPAMVAGILSNERELQLAMTTQFRILLAKTLDQNPPIDEVIQSGVVPRLVEFLTREDFPQLQFEAAWALTNIASGTSENTRVVIDHGAVPIFVMLLGSSSDDVRNQAVWALGNITGDSDPKFRELVLSHGALIPLLALLNENAKPKMLGNAAWTLSNFCRGKPQPPVFEQLKPALPTLEHLLRSNDEEVLQHACWALSYLSEVTHNIQAVIDAHVCKRLVELLDHPSTEVCIPALRTVGNIVTGNEVQTQCIIDYGVLPCLLSLLGTHHLQTSIMKESCWTISNITAGNRDQIQAVIEAGLIGPLVNLLQTADFGIKKEAAWAILNVTTGGTNKQITYLVNQNCIKPLCDILVWPDVRMVEVCLEGLKNILMVGDQAERGNGVNRFAKLIDEAGGFEKIKKLRHDKNNNVICAKAARILQAHWREDDVALPAIDEAQLRFNFGSMVIQSGR